MSNCEVYTRNFIVMKNLIAFLTLIAVLFLSACASTPRQSSGSGGEASAEEQSSTGSRLLMDRYKSGEIPGYRE